MSHIVTIKAEIRDAQALGSACRRLELAQPEHRTAKLYSQEATGHCVQLPGWSFPVVCDLATGQVRYDNYEGRWGEQKHLDRLTQAYTVEKAKLEARRKGYSVTERAMPNGNIQLEVKVP